MIHNLKEMTENKKLIIDVCTSNSFRRADETGDGEGVGDCDWLKTGLTAQLR